MCLSEYDLVCDKCRKKHDKIFAKLLEKPDYTVEEEREAYEKWVKSLCKECRETLKEEGFLVNENEPRSNNETEE